MNAKQIDAFEALKAKTLRNNCRIHSSKLHDVTAKVIGRNAVVSFVAVDEGKGYFQTFVCAVIGPRGGVKIVRNEFSVI